MFKYCRKKKKPVEEACALSWKPIEEPSIIWPSKIQENDTQQTQIVPKSKEKEDAVIQQNGIHHKIETLQKLTIDPPNQAIFEDITDALHQVEITNTYKMEILEQIEVDPSKIATFQAYSKYDKVYPIEQFRVDERETYQIPPPQIATLDDNVDYFYDVTRSDSKPRPPMPLPGDIFQDEQIPSIEITHEIDANDNVIHNQLQRNSKDNISLNAPTKSKEMRFTTNSVFSSESDSIRLSNTSVEMRKRKAFREDDDDLENVELVPQDISPSDEKIIKKAIQANDFIMAVGSNVIDVLPRYMTLSEVERGDVIMRQGDIGNFMCVSKSGEYKIEMDNQTIDKFKGPRLFGELAILFDADRSATVLATKDGSLWTVQRHIFRTLLRQSNITAKDNILAFLRKIPVINETSSQKLRQIADLCETRFYPKGSVIVQEGQRGDEFFIVKTGNVVVSKMGVGKIKILKSGDYFGERALLYDEDKRKATVTSIEYGAECIVLKRHEFNEYLGDVRKFLEEKTEPKEIANQVQNPVVDESRFLPYKEIHLEGLKKIKLLGEGGFGTVYLVKTPKGKLFALKELKIKKVQSSKTMEKAMNEKNIQRACDSPFIVQLYRTYVDEVNMYFLLEYCPRAELFTLLRKKRHFPDTLARFTGACILEALAYLHLRYYAYLDLKPENIFIDKEGYPKIGDFGNAVKLLPDQKTFCFAGTLEYMAPEIIQTSGTDMAADYWAFGVLNYEMLLGRSPFRDKSEERLFDNITKGLTGKHFVPNFNKPAKDLIKRLMDVNPAKRLGCLRDGIEGIYKHEWFQGFDFKKLKARQMTSPLLKLYKR